MIDLPISKPKTLPRGLRNKNPLNIRRSTVNYWKGRRIDITDNDFEEFTSIDFGIRAAMVIIRNWLKKHVVRTPEEIIKKWAPDCENDTEAYIRSVAALSGVSMKTDILFYEKSKITKLCRAMALVENGLVFADYLPLDLFEKAYGMV